MASSRILSYIILFVLFSSCKDDILLENDENKIFGSFNATTFIEPGSLDAGVDILQGGGKFTVTLKENFIASGNLLIPENIGSTFPNGETNYSGFFTVSNDTIRFQGTSTLLDNPQLFFIIKNSSLESGGFTGRGGLFKIIFIKQ